MYCRPSLYARGDTVSVQRIGSNWHKTSFQHLYTCCDSLTGASGQRTDNSARRFTHSKNSSKNNA